MPDHLPPRVRTAPRATAPYPSTPVRQFSFTDFSINNPTTPQPGNNIDSEYDRSNASISQIINWLGVSLNTDGTLATASVGAQQIAPGVFDFIATDAINQVQPLVDDAQSYASSASSSSATAQAAATAADTSNRQAQGAATAATTSAASATTGAQAANSSALAAQTSATNAANDANDTAGDVAICTDYGVLTQAWAEHMPDPIPPNILAVMGITGDHWSSRWWATKAEAAFGSLASLYLGAWPNPPLTTATGDPIPLGAIYYNTTTGQPYVWNGNEWMPFYAPTKAYLLTLLYHATANQTVFPLTHPDLGGQTYVMSTVDPEPLEIYVNGDRLPQNAPNPGYGAWDVNPTTSTVTFITPLAASAVVQIDILTPASALTPTRVQTEALLDFNIHPGTGTPGQIDGTRTSFPLILNDGNYTPVSAGSAQELFIMLDGVVQQPSTDFSISGGNIAFAEAPVPGARVWGAWYGPGHYGPDSGNGFLPLSGGVMTGPITLSGNPTAAGMAANKAYVDSTVGASGGPFLALAGGTLSGPLVLAADPAAALGAATKQYVDAHVPVGGPFLPTGGGTMGGPLFYTATGGTKPRSAQDRAADVANVLDYGADPTGAADSTAAIRAALAVTSARNVYLPAGNYYITNSLTVGAGNVSQRLFGDGEASAIMVDTAFNPAASGVVVLTGTQTPLASHPAVERLCIQFAVPTDLTATLSSASGTTLTLTAAVPAGVVVGDYVTDDTDWAGIQVNNVTMSTPTPVEGTKVTAISGNQVTLSLPVVAGHIAAGHLIRFAHPRSMLRNLGAAPPPSTGVGGYGARYPWAILANGAGVPTIDSILINGAYNGIQCHPATGGGNFRITNCRIGALNVGIDVDACADGGFVDRHWFNAYGIYVPAQTSNTAFGQIYYDGQTVAMSLGRTDGCMLSNILTFQAKINVLTAWTYGHFVNINMDGAQAAFSIGQGAQEVVQITNLRCGTFTSSSTCIVTNFRMDCGNRAVPSVVIDNGSEARLIGGSIEWATPGSVVVRNSATLRLTGVTFDNCPSSNWSGGLVHATTAGVVNMLACNFISGGIGPGLVIDNDSAWGSALGNFWGQATFTPPGQLGKYQPGLPAEQGGIAAAGTTQGTATPLTAYYSNVTTVPVAGNGVMLPAWAPLGSRWVVWSNGASAMNVWPPPGYNIGAGTNVAVSLAPLTKGIWVAWDGLVFVREN